MTQAIFHERHVYGAIKFYPANGLALAVCDLLGVKTLEKRHDEKLAAVGIQVVRERLEGLK